MTDTNTTHCWAAVSLGGIMVVRCAEQGEHIAHQAVLTTETRASSPRAEGVEKRHVIYWYDHGNVHLEVAASPFACGWCPSCDPERARFMVTCPDCGNKRCPKATHHNNACTGSNDAGQIGSRYA